jgi:hypothetical protein
MMAGRSSNSAGASAARPSDVSDSEAALRTARWPRFSGRVEDFEEFKTQWLKMDKTGIGDQDLLRGLWELCLPLNLSRRPGRFLEAAEAWEWLDSLFAYNDLCKVVDEEYYDYPKMCSPVDWYRNFLLLKAEIFDLYGTGTWNMAVVGKMLDKLPKTERILWSQFEELQSAFIEDWPWKFIRFMTLREINLQFKVVSGRPMNHTVDWQHLPETSRPTPPTLAVAATAVTSW